MLYRAEDPLPHHIPRRYYVSCDRSRRDHVDKKSGPVITDALGSDAAALEREAGPLGRALIATVDKAAHLQSGTVRSYVDRVRRHNPDATPAEAQAILDKHFRNTVSGTGAGAGLAAAIPGIGLLTGSAAIAGESVAFLDIAAFYAMASAYLRGVDINDPERRRAIVLIVLTGAQGLSVVDTVLRTDGSVLTSIAGLSKFSGPRLAEANSILTRTALKAVTKRLRRAWLGKLLPLGLGAVAGASANRTLAATVVESVGPSLGPLPAAFDTPLTEVEKRDEPAANGKKGLFKRKN